MSAALRDVRRIWRGRRGPARGDRLASGYVAALLAAMLLAPVVRGIWLLGSDPILAAQVVDATPPRVVVAAVAAAWSAAVVAGMLRGPVVMAPALAHALATSPIPTSIAFRRPVALAVAGSAVLGTALAVALAVTHHAVAPWSATAWAGAVALGATVGVVTVCCWLVGQTVARRTGAALAASAAVAGVATALLPMPQIGLETALVVLVAVATIALPTLLGRLDPRVVEMQSARWERVRGHASLLDLAGAADAYRMPPARRRALQVVRPASGVTATIVMRDALAATRTPTRLVVGVGALVLSGVLVAVAASSPSALLALAIPAGLLATAASGVLADGLRHAVDAIASQSPYGLSDGILVGSHAVLPLISAVVLVLVGVGIASLLSIGGLGTGVLAGAVLAAGAVAVRIVALLKSTLPVALLVPIVTPAGDASAMVRALWSLDGVWMALAVGVAAATVTTAPGVAVLAAAWIVAVGAWRWSRR